MRPERRRLRSLLELGAIVVLSGALYATSAALDLPERMDRWLDQHRDAPASEMLLVLPFALALLLVYSWRRHREAQAETEAAVAAERELERTNEEFRSLFDHHPHAVFAIDPQRRYRRLNPAAETLSGYTEQEMRSLTFPALKSRDRERVIAAFERTLDRAPQRLEATLDDKHGGRRDVDVTMIPIMVDGDPVGVFVVADDVTEDKRMRGRLAQALADAEAATEAKTLLVANVSHELRTPLAAVLAAAELLSDSHLDDSQQRLLAMVDRNGHSLLRLVEDLLDVSRLDVGLLDVESVPVDLSAVVDQAVAHVCPRAREKGLAVRVHLDAPMPPDVLGDPLRLGQVLTNLLVNAVKFTETGEVGVSVDWQRCSETQVEASFRVRDTGIGVAPEDQERLFGTFVQADPSSTRKYGGAGLGLAISRRLVTAMGGELSVESTLGVGSTFTARIPLQRRTAGE